MTLGTMPRKILTIIYDAQVLPECLRLCKNILEQAARLAFSSAASQNNSFESVNEPETN